MCVYVLYRREFHFHASKGEQPRVPAFVFGCLYQCVFSMSEMFSWNIPMKTRQQAKVWHVFLANFYPRLASFHFLLKKIGKTYGGTKSQRRCHCATRHPIAMARNFSTKQLLCHCHCCNLEKLSAITKISHLGRFPKVVLFLGEIKNSMQSSLKGSWGQHRQDSMNVERYLRQVAFHVYRGPNCVSLRPTGEDAKCMHFRKYIYKTRCI